MAWTQSWCWLLVVIVLLSLVRTGAKNACISLPYLLVVPYERKCLGCEASAWCSAQCQDQDQREHNVICEPLRCIHEKKRELPDSAALVVRALVRNKTDPLLAYDLVDGGDLDTKEVYAHCLQQTLPASFLAEFGATEDLIKRILSISTFNSFGLYDGRFADEGIYPRKESNDQSMSQRKSKEMEVLLSSCDRGK